MHLGIKTTLAIGDAAGLQAVLGGGKVVGVGVVAFLVAGLLLHALHSGSRRLPRERQAAGFTV